MLTCTDCGATGWLDGIADNKLHFDPVSGHGCVSESDWLIDERFHW